MFISYKGFYFIYFSKTDIYIYILIYLLFNNLYIFEVSKTKKIIYLILVLVLALFIISACQGTVGAPTPTRNQVTYQGVLNMLSGCDVYAYEPIGIDKDGLTTGNNICNGHSQTCVSAERFYDQGNGYYTSLMTQCDTNEHYTVLRTLCCSPTSSLPQ